MIRAGILLVAPAAALTLSLTPLPVQATAPWWQLDAFPGQAVTRVSVVSGRLVAMVGGEAMGQTSSGFAPVAPPPPAAPAVTAGSVTWSIDPAGRVLVSRLGSGPTLDPGSPDLGAGADLIASPRALPGVVLAVSTSGMVWCRAADGGWSASLLLLPTTLVTGTPAVTSITAFNQSPLSDAVYLGTDGYGTLLTVDGGADWTRADPGLPEDVLSLAADPAGSGAVWAGTAQGLYVHHLQALPTVPNYSGGSLAGKWLLTALVCAVVVVLAALALVLWSRRPRPAV